MGLVILRERIRRALMGKLRRAPPAVAAAPPWRRHPIPAAVERLHGLVSRIRARSNAGGGSHCDHQSWLAVWHAELQAVLDMAERVLLAVAMQAARSDHGTDVVGGEELRRTARSVEAEAAHLEDFATLVRFACASLLVVGGHALGLGPGN